MASLSSVERFNPHLNKWVEVREMGQRRAGNGVSKLNGCLYVVGERKVYPSRNDACAAQSSLFARKSAKRGQ